MKRAIKLFIAGLMFMTSNIYATGIPVIDGAGNLLMQGQYGEQIAEYGDTARLLEKLQI
jgi:hypothetical protein